MEINVELILLVSPAILLGLVVMLIIDVVKWRKKQITLIPLFQRLVLRVFWAIFASFSAMFGMRCPLTTGLYWLILGPYVSKRRWWMPVSSLILFGLSVLIEESSLPESYFVYLPIEGFLLGMVQWFLLRKEFRRAWLWFLGMTVGWGVGGNIVLIAFLFFENLFSAETSQLLMVEPGAIGGLFAGILTGSLLWWLFENHRVNTPLLCHENKIEVPKILTVD